LHITRKDETKHNDKKKIHSSNMRIMWPIT